MSLMQDSSMAIEFERRREKEKIITTKMIHRPQEVRISSILTIKSINFWAPIVYWWYSDSFVPSFCRQLKPKGEACEKFRKFRWFRTCCRTLPNPFRTFSTPSRWTSAVYDDVGVLGRGRDCWLEWDGLDRLDFALNNHFPCRMVMTRWSRTSLDWQIAAQMAPWSVLLREASPLREQLESFLSSYSFVTEGLML